MGGDEEDVVSASAEEISDDDLQAMRKTGLEKPEGIPWSRWLAPQKVSPRHNVIAYMAAQGIRQADIAKHTGLSASRISLLLNNPKIKNEILYLQRQMFGEDPRKKISSLVNDAIDVTESIMKNEQERGATRLAAAQMIQERALGKPTQQIEIGTNLIRAMMERLDQKDRDRKTIDVTTKIEGEALSLEAFPGDNEILEVPEVVEVEKIPAKVPASPVDAWIDNYLGEK